MLCSGHDIATLVLPICDRHKGKEMHLHMNKIMTHRLVVRVVLGVTMACGVGMPVLLHGQASSRDSAEIRNYFQEAVRALQANEPAVAVRAYRAILKIDPKNVDALANLGSVAFVQKDWKRQHGSFIRHSNCNPHYGKPRRCSGCASCILAITPRR